MRRKVEQCAALIKRPPLPSRAARDMARPRPWRDWGRGGPWAVLCRCWAPPG